MVADAIQWGREQGYKCGAEDWNRSIKFKEAVIDQLKAALDFANALIDEERPAVAELQQQRDEAVALLRHLNNKYHLNLEHGDAKQVHALLAQTGGGA